MHNIVLYMGEVLSLYIVTKNGNFCGSLRHTCDYLRNGLMKTGTLFLDNFGRRVTILHHFLFRSYFRPHWGVMGQGIYVSYIKQ